LIVPFAGAAALLGGRFIFCRFCQHAGTLPHVRGVKFSHQRREDMFRETLLESANSNRKHNRWPMVMALTAEVIVIAALAVLPLLSTGVIQVSAHTPTVSPLGQPYVPRPVIRRFAGDPISVTHAALDPVVVPVTAACLYGCRDHQHNSGPSDDDGAAYPTELGVKNGDPNLPFGGPNEPPHLVPPRQRPPVAISHLSEAQLMTRVDPVYPRMAIITGIQGEVQLHAIIAKDGTIQSLSLVKGSPMLATAAIDAVRQWRYRPYVLNGEVVEVETFITVNFRKTSF
jgi:protein TonB